MPEECEHGTWTESHCLPMHQVGSNAVAPTAAQICLRAEHTCFTIVPDWPTAWQAYLNVGIVAGRYYDVAGRATPELLKLQALRPEQAPAAAQPAKMPGMEPCGMRWADGQSMPFAVQCQNGMVDGSD